MSAKQAEQFAIAPEKRYDDPVHPDHHRAKGENTMKYWRAPESARQLHSRDRGAGETACYSPGGPVIPSLSPHNSRSRGSLSFTAP